MIDISEKTILVHDSGSFFEIALKLADYYKEVLYYVPWTAGFPGMDKAVIGCEWKDKEVQDSFDGKPLRRIENFFDYVDEADIIFFTDCYDGDLMEYLRRQGKLVCGSGAGQELELEKYATLEIFADEGMDVAPMKAVIGIDALRKELQKNENRFIKIGKYRKTIETFHHSTYKLTEPILSKIEWELGPLAKVMEFIIQEPIDAIVEEGADLYSVDGIYPKTVLSGVEIKDMAYAGKMIPYNKQSPGVLKTNEQIGAFLKEYEYRGFLSTEVRTTKDDKNYLIDPTMRLPQPPSSLYTLIWGNLGEIVWGLANGKVIDPEPEAPYGMYATISSDWYDEHHQPIYFPEKYRDNVKLNYPVKIDGAYYCLNINNFPEVGSIVAVGDSFEACKKQIEDIAASIEGYGITVRIDKLDAAIEEFGKMEKTK